MPWLVMSIGSDELPCAKTTDIRNCAAMNAISVRSEKGARIGTCVRFFSWRSGCDSGTRR